MILLTGSVCNSIKSRHIIYVCSVCMYVCMRHGRREKKIGTVVSPSGIDSLVCSTSGFWLITKCFDAAFESYLPPKPLLTDRQKVLKQCLKLLNSLFFHIKKDSI